MSDGDQPGRAWTWSWEDQELEQLRHGARLSLSDKLAWLEEVYEVALSLQRPHRFEDEADAGFDTEGWTTRSTTTKT